LIEHPLGKFTEICVEGCAYIGSGDVLKGILLIFDVNSLIIIPSL
jgi:hypothetical protein